MKRGAIVMAFAAVVAVVAVVACKRAPAPPRVVTEGTRFTLGPEESATCGSLEIAVRRDPKSKREGHDLVLHQGGLTLERFLWSGKERIKFGTHVLATDTPDDYRSIAIELSPWKPSSPVSGDDATLLAEEGWRTHCGGRALCQEARRSLDTKLWIVRCQCISSSDSESRVEIDAASGDVRSMTRTGGA